MFDLLRVLRSVRSVGFLVGAGRNNYFRTFAVLLTCVGVGLTLGGANVAGAVVALACWGAYVAFRHGRSNAGAHRY